MILMVPRDAVPYPTLGPQVCDFIEQNMVRGPGDLRGQPVILDDEWRALIFRMYEVFPKGHALAGRRRFKRVGLSLPKGLAKTESAAMIAACELHPDAPVRWKGFTKKGEPIGGPVTDPYIPMVAYTQEQSDELAFTVSSPNAGVVTNPRSFTRFSDAAQEVVEVRILQGIHFRHADELGRLQGQRVAHWTFQKFLRPIPGSN